jgi:hypothetical protein
MNQFSKQLYTSHYQGGSNVLEVELLVLLLFGFFLGLGLSGIHLDRHGSVSVLNRLVVDGRSSHVSLSDMSRRDMSRRDMSRRDMSRRDGSLCRYKRDPLRRGRFV